MNTRERIARAAAENGWTVAEGGSSIACTKANRRVYVEFSTRGGVTYASGDGSRALGSGKADWALARLEAGPRYEARMNTLPAVPAIYDTYTKTWPALLRGTYVPQSFPTMEDAQAWADEHLNGGS